MRMDISRLIGARLKAVRRKTARLKSARLKAVMELLPLRRIKFFFFHARTHTHSQTHTYSETQTQIRTHNEIDNHSIRPMIFIFVRGIHSQTHTHTHTHIYIYIFILIFNTAATLPESAHVRSGLRIAIRLPAIFRRGFQP